MDGIHKYVPVSERQQLDFLASDPSTHRSKSLAGCLARQNATSDAGVSLIHGSRMTAAEGRGLWDHSKSRGQASSYPCPTHTRSQCSLLVPKSLTAWTVDSWSSSKSIKLKFVGGEGRGRSSDRD